MNPALSHLVTAAGTALEVEDRYLLGAVTANSLAYKDENGGILRINNERYYQFIVARALMSSLPYKVSVEQDYHDLVLHDPNTGNRFATVEMKRWMSPTGERELPAIRRDLFEKLRSAKSELKLLLLFSANPPGQMNHQIAWLSERLDLLSDKWATHCFPTIDTLGNNVEYWIGGYQTD